MLHCSAVVLQLYKTMGHLIILYFATAIHILASIYLISKIWSTKSCAGISGKAHFLYALVYTARYLDLFSKYFSLLNELSKIVYLVLAYVTVLSLYVFFRKTREKQYDTFRVELLLVCCAVIALLNNHEFNVMEVLWTFSIYLEAVAMIPQFHMISKARYVHTHVFRYLVALAVYKFLYLPHWGYRYYMEGHYDKLAIASAIVQCIIYLDFFARVVPKLQSRIVDVRPEIAIIGAQIENNGEWLKDNMGNVVLTPSSLLDASSDKANLLKPEESK